MVSEVMEVPTDDLQVLGERLRELTDTIAKAEDKILADPAKATWQELFQYAHLLGQLFDMSTDKDHLSQSIGIAEHAAERMSTASPLEKAAVLSHIGLCLGKQHHVDPSQFPRSLDRGIEKLSEAVKMIRPQRDLDMLQGLRILLRKRFALTPTDEDSTFVLALAEEILDGSPPQETKWTANFKAWGAALVMVLLRELQVGAVDTASVIQKSLETIQGYWSCMDKAPAEDRLERRKVILKVLAQVSAIGVVNQANARDLYDSKPPLQDSLAVVLERAITLIAFDSESTDYFKLLSAVSSTPQEDTIDPTIQLFKQHSGGRDDPGALDSMVMGLLHKDKFESTGDKNSLQTAIDLLGSVSSLKTSPVLQRIDAARMCAVLLRHDGNHSAAYKVLSTAVQILPQLSTRSMRRTNQERNLSIVAGLAEEACATAIAANCTATEAIAVLEQAAGLIMSFEIDRRTDAPLFEDPALVEAFEAAQEHLHAVSINSSSTKTQHDDAWTEYQDAVNSIRTQIPEFLRPLNHQELCGLAKDGPLVILNCHMLRSDAIVISGSTVQHVPLQVDHSELEEKMQKLVQSIHGTLRTYRARCLALKSLLGWLWDQIVKPVWDALRALEMPQRIFWMRTGALALAPIHAAGTFSVDAHETRFDEVISSYIPTLKALAYARAKADIRAISKRFVAVAMPTTPGERSFQSLDDEINAIKKTLLANEWRITTVTHPCAKDVIQHLIDAPTILHCGCHGVSSYHQPSESALLFVKSSGADESSGDTVLDPLTVARLNDVWLKRAPFITYLSACSTSGTLNARIGGQALHLAAELLLLGLSHVVGTAWESQDDACRVVATAFYNEIGRLETRELDSCSVATAWHRAINTLRQQGAEDVLAWLPFVHYGI